MAAAVIGLLGATVLWVVTPYNNYLFGLAPLTDSYLPIGALFVVLLITLLANPLLYRLKPALALNRGQLTLVISVLLMAGVLPGQGLMRQLPHMLPQAVHEICQNPRLAAIYEQMDLPRSLLLAEPGAGERTPEIAGAFLDCLSEGERIPWSGWIPLLLSWGLSCCLPG